MKEEEKEEEKGDKEEDEEVEYGGGGGEGEECYMKIKNAIANFFLLSKTMYCLQLDI